MFNQGHTLFQYILFFLKDTPKNHGATSEVLKIPTLLPMLSLGIIFVPVCLSDTCFWRHCCFTDSRNEIYSRSTMTQLCQRNPLVWIRWLHWNCAVSFAAHCVSPVSMNSQSLTLRCRWHCRDFSGASGEINRRLSRWIILLKQPWWRSKKITNRQSCESLLFA